MTLGCTHKKPYRVRTPEDRTCATAARYNKALTRVLEPFRAIESGTWVYRGGWGGRDVARNTVRYTHTPFPVRHVRVFSRAR